MISAEQLDKAKHAGAGSAVSEEPVDLAEVRITGTTAEERLESFLSQVLNPCRYRVGKTTVRVSFAPGAASLEDKLKAYFTALKQNAFGAQINP